MASGSSLIGRRVQVLVEAGKPELHDLVGEIVDVGRAGTYGGWQVLVLWPDGSLSEFSPYAVRIVGGEGSPHR